MKKLLFIILVFFVTTVSGQLSEGLQAKNDGNDAYKANNYVLAIKHYEKYLSSGEEEVEDDLNTLTLLINSYKFAGNEFLKNQDYKSALSYFEKYMEKGGADASQDSRTVYSMAFASNKLNNNVLAVKYFQKSIELNYRPDMCKLYIADIYKGEGKDEQMKEVLVEAMEKHPDSKVFDKMASMLTTPLLRDAAVPFNRGNELAKEASSGSPNEYLVKMALAVEKFEEAIPLFQEALKFDAKNEMATTYLKVSQDNIKAFNDYKASLEKK
jgi:tetratricopeptide (TPR) repeat protein